MRTNQPCVSPEKEEKRTMSLTEVLRRRVTISEAMMAISEDIECQQQYCEGTHCRKSNSKRLFSNQWISPKATQGRAPDVALLVASVIYSLVALFTMHTRCGMMQQTSQVSLHKPLFFAHLDKPLVQSEPPDYDGISFISLQNASIFSRKIFFNGNLEYEKSHLLVAADDIMSLEEPAINSHCREPSWKSRFYPTCNVMHEGDFVADEKSYQIG